MNLRLLMAALPVATSLLAVAGAAYAQGGPSAGRAAQQGNQGQPPANQPPAGQQPPVVPPPAGEPVAPPPPPPPSTTQYPVQPWRLPAIEVLGEARPALREEELIGDYGQPRWTANRR